jgi:hypothetical protein
MVTLISESPLYILSSKRVPESCVTRVICHHNLAQIRVAAGSRSGPDNIRVICQKPCMGTALGATTSRRDYPRTSDGQFYRSPALTRSATACQVGLFLFRGSMLPRENP